MSGSADKSGVGADARRRFGILAYPAAHSLSPVMFNAAFAALGMVGVSYEVFEGAPEKFEAFMLAREFDGLSVSAPYKERVIEFLDFVDEDAKKIGAVNTVSKGWCEGGSRDSSKGWCEGGGRDLSRGQLESGTLHGYNTDFIGAVDALKEECGSLQGKKVVVLGTGGAARAITYGLVKEGVEVVVLGRDLEDASKLGEDFGVEVGSLSSVEEYKCDILVQATSVWITSGLDVKIVPDSFVEELGTRGGVVMDIVYKPLMTPLLEVARDAGCRVITGNRMLLNQAVKQFEIWFGEEAPKEVMGKVFGRM